LPVCLPFFAEQTPDSTTLLHGPDAIGEGEKMAMTALFLFIGGVFGFRFKVLILIPAIILILIVTGSIELAQRQDAWSTALMAMVAVIAIQMGYLSGVATAIFAKHAVTTAERALERPRLCVNEWFTWFIRP
jgi:hypothetical protein